jgi:KRAB domain-containing zinc finger protein
MYGLQQSFPGYQTLKRHSGIHVKEKLYIWRECDKSFPKASTVQAHHRLHTGYKSYKYKV